MEHKDEQEVKADVEHCTNQQKVEGGLAVAQCTDDACQQVVSQVARDGDEGDEEIDVGIVEYFLWSLHPAKDVGA